MREKNKKEVKEMRKGYRVLGGYRQCLPDMIKFFKTKEEAKKWLSQKVTSLREAGYQFRKVNDQQYREVTTAIAYEFYISATY
ncbi:hypothetical protein DRN93_04745 [archaeon]|nr:MAG: hypothetical protein DRN93_04745 [archaeon]